MRRGRILIFVLLILVIGLVVVALLFRQVLPQVNQPPQPANVDVFVVSQSIPQGGDITEDVLTTISLPQDRVAAVMFTRDELGSLTSNKVAKYPLDPGVIITEAMVSDKSAAVPIAGPQWASLIPPGMTAISIPASRLSLAGYAVSDGAQVNINACFLFVDVDPTFQTILPNLTASLTGTGFPADALPILSLGVGAAAGPQGRLELEPSVQQPYYLIPSEAQRPRQVCQMLLQNVSVLKLGNFPLTQAQATPGEAPADQAQQPPAIPDIVTLIVSPQDSITLSYLVYTNAQLMLTLRNPSDQARQATEASTLQFVLSQYNIPVPAKLPYSMQPPLTALIAPGLPNDTVTVSP
jgi:pilus assembly protein CpaB